MKGDALVNTIIYGELGLFSLIAVCIIVLIFRRIKLDVQKTLKKEITRH